MMSMSPNLLRAAIVLLFVATVAKMLWEGLAAGGAAGPRIAGAGYAVWVLVAALLLLILHLLYNIWPAYRREPDPPNGFLPPSRVRGHLFLFIATWIAYVVLLPMLGFIAATFLAVSLSVCVLDRFRLWTVLAGAAVFTLAIKILFRSVFYVSLPEAAPDEWLDMLLYQL